MASSNAHNIRLSYSETSSTSSNRRGKSKTKKNEVTSSQQRKTLSLPEHWTVQDLKEESLRLFFQGSKTAKKKIQVQLLSGYPPTPLSHNRNQTSARSCILPNESLIVRFVNTSETISDTKKTPSTPTKSQVKKKKQELTSNPCNENEEKNEQEHENIPKSRKRRAAAIAASSNFTKVIKAQDALLEAEKQKKTKSTQIAKSSSRKPPKQATISKSNSRASRKLSQTTGRKLSDGSFIQATRQTSSTTSKSKSNMALKDETDVATKLLSSLESGGNGKIGSFLRGAMRNTVTKSYESSRAFIRVSAVQSRQYRILPKEEYHLNTLDGANNKDTSPSLRVYRVQYSKGKVSNQRGNYTEDFQLISRSTLISVIRAVYTDPDPQGGGKEMLRARNMAQLSPRVYWSIVYHTIGNPVSMHAEQTNVKDVEEGLKSLLPELNWKYLQGRTQILSEKAKENLRQQQESENSENNNVDLEKGMKAVDAVQEAMVQVLEENGALARERAVRAALGRLGTTSDKNKVDGENETMDEWKLVTPTEEDLDELNECVSEVQSISKDFVADIVASLITDCNIRNWRELANADRESIYKLLLPNRSEDRPSEDSIDVWIDVAQSKSVDEIMMEICDMNEDAVYYLRENASAGTPKDLALWESMPDMLLDEVGDNKKYIHLKELQIWCTRSKWLLQEYEWLNWYATPIS